MPRKSTKKSREEIRQEKKALYADIKSGWLTLGQATRRMRNIVGLTQKEYAEKVQDLSPDAHGD